jgi:branched-chain amino acid transport system substrate-binding protein
MTVWQKADKKYPYSPENTGMTFAPVKEYPNYVSSTPTSCQMKRPG